ncbi:MAG: glycosyltransferase family 4 protein [Acidobacteriota bacterium]
MSEPSPALGTPLAVTVLVPGDLARRTGGYGYDREIIAGLRTLGWRVAVVSLDGSFPQPSATARVEAAQALAALPDGTLVLADGLAFGVMGVEAEREARRLSFVALVHHPLADETGLDEDLVAEFEASERRALAATRGVVVTSHATRRRLADFGVSGDRVAVVVPGTTPSPLARGTRGTSGADSDVPVALLCVASLVPRKGHDVLVAALARLRHLSWHLTCAGSQTLHPPTTAKVQAQLHALGLVDRVTLAGELDEAALAAAYDRADLFVLATRHEGYGMAVAEALACGVPVVSTATGGISELVDATSGVIVPMDDPEALAEALAPLVSDDGARARAIAGARATRDSLPRWDEAARAMAAALTRFAAHGTVQR